MKEMKPEMLDVPEVGGLQRVDVANIPKDKPYTYMVKGYEVVETEWGKRVDFTVCDEYQEWTLSSWQISSKKRMKPTDIVGKNIKLSYMTEKKCLVEIIS